MLRMNEIKRNNRRLSHPHFIRAKCTKEEESVAWNEEVARIEEAVDKWYAYTACNPVQETEGVHRVVVDIVRGPEEAHRKKDTRPG